MAYMNQERKKVISEALKPVLAKYNLKGTLRTNHYAITLTIRQGKLDFISNWKENLKDEEKSRINCSLDQIDSLDINHYWIDETFSGEVKECLHEIIKAIKAAGYHDNSDIMTDYFDVAYYFSIKVGDWDKPYTLIK